MPHRRDITDEMVADLYFRQGLNRRQVAEKLGCSLDLFDYRMRRMGLETKRMSDCVEAGKRRNVSLSQEFLERMDGEMLGDGHMYVYKAQGSFRESFGHDKLEWAEWLLGWCAATGLPLVGQGLNLRKPSGKSKNPTWSLCTANAVELGDIQRRWYVVNPNFDPSKPCVFGNRKHIKTVPGDLRLTPNVLLHWYIGDGAPLESGGCHIHTEGFSFEEVEFLRLRLRDDLGIFSTKRPNNTIGIIRREREKLLEAVGGCPVGCYLYKWTMPATSCRKQRKVDDSIDMPTVARFLAAR